MNDDDQEPVPAVFERFDLERPSVARVYDYFLGGSAHWTADRVFGEQAIKRFPFVRSLAVANRRWLGRVVRSALDAGITQFIDLGSGLPTRGAVHEIVGQHPGQASVVYVDNDPVAHAHMKFVLDKGVGLARWVTALLADLREPERILEDEETQDLIDFTQPVCVLMVAILHFVGGETDDVPELLGRYRDAMAPGSWLAISHVAQDAVTDAAQAAQMAALVDSYQETPTPAFLRDRAEITSWLTSWGGLINPGVVHLPDWHPDAMTLDSTTHLIRPFSWCGVASKASAKEVLGSAGGRSEAM